MAKVGDIFKLSFGDAGILACIDIDEPIVAKRGIPKDVLFRYRAGVPHSTAFDIWWFFTAENAEALENRLDPAVHIHLPTTEIDPPVPQLDTGDWQGGVVTLTVPEHYADDFILYGAMIIYQPDA